MNSIEIGTGETTGLMVYRKLLLVPHIIASVVSILIWAATIEAYLVIVDPFGLSLVTVAGLLVAMRIGTGLAEFAAARTDRILVSERVHKEFQERFATTEELKNWLKITPMNVIEGVMRANEEEDKSTS